MANQLEVSNPGNPTVRKDVERILASSASFQELDPRTQQAMTDSLAKITAYLANPEHGPGEAVALAGPMDLRRQLAPHSDGGSPTGTEAPSAPPPSQQDSQSTAPQPGGGAQTVTGRVGEVARATLSAIDFPSFVASLVHGTFQSIVDSSIRQRTPLGVIAGRAEQLQSRLAGDARCE